MQIDRLGRFALIAVLLAAGAEGQVAAETCGTIASPDGQYRASLTLAGDGASPRTIVFLCDLRFNCDTVFVAPQDARLGLQWRDRDLTIYADAGTMPVTGSLHHSGKGRPAVGLSVAHAPPPASALRLDLASCRVEPIITATPPR